MVFEKKAKVFSFENQINPDIGVRGCGQELGLFEEVFGGGSTC